MPSKKGRPSRSDEAATKRVSIPLTTKEKKELDDYARQQGKDTAGFIRDAALKEVKKQDDQPGE